MFPDPTTAPSDAGYAAPPPEPPGLPDTIHPGVGEPPPPPPPVDIKSPWHVPVIKD